MISASAAGPVRPDLADLPGTEPNGADEGAGMAQ